MHVENNPDFKTIWQLAHDWAGEKPDQTDPNAISPKLRLYIDRLIRGIGSKEISARWKGHRIFIDESFLTFVFDLRHFIKFYIWVMFNKFSKDYLDNLYVKRNEVIIWCDRVALLEPPPCWSHKKLAAIDYVNSESVDPDDENNGWYHKITERRRQRVVCIELAKQLWELNPNLSYEEMQNHSIMQQFGYSSTFSSKSFKNLVRSVASVSAQSPGAPAKSKE
ncbi:hypothetical protein [Nitrosomonas sp. Nm166]|uniref:hypothetical protein n=1 Tax=Nitrosomonas sp. Nm166 TaxID=1881054 RepID=UPI0008F00977|nr:hypothetical protein [Nitrosomonas sp. Nm166]SFF15026.1 hypothetical protein SAMN05428977_10578 [Nitrosomonas sp. Nm166]